MVDRMVIDYEDAKYEYQNEYGFKKQNTMKNMVNRKNRMNDLIKVLEDNFSLHDSDEIYNLLSEFSEVDTDCGRITFKQWLRGKNER